MFRQEIQAEWPQDKEQRIAEQTALALVARYNIITERHDQIFCSGQRGGVAYPRDMIERRSMDDHARLENERMEQDAEKLGISKDTLRWARKNLRRYSHEGNEKHYNRFKHLLGEE